VAGRSPHYPYDSEFVCRIIEQLQRGSRIGTPSIKPFCAVLATQTPEEQVPLTRAQVSEPHGCDGGIDPLFELAYRSERRYIDRDCSVANGPASQWNVGKCNWGHELRAFAELLSALNCDQSL
jgi:hypothetical protein